MSILRLENAKVHFPIRGGFFNRVVDYVRAVDDVTLEIEEGKTYGLIGESGSGKTTIGKVIVGLEKLTGGKMYFGDTDISTARAQKMSKYNQDVQMIFQDAMASLDPRKRVRDIIAEPLRNFESLSPQEELKRVHELLDIVGMPSDAIYKYPFEFSGGQRQRIGIARAVACKPRLIVADEPVSALDLSVQAQVLNYMKDIQDQYNLSYLFISHDLGVVKHMCDYIYIMNNGRFVETGNRADIYKEPLHIYTKKLIAAIPHINPDTRQESAKLRKEVERAYDKNAIDYFDEKGRAYDLELVNGTHYVATKGGIA